MRTGPTRAAVSAPPAEHELLREHTPMRMRRTRAAGQDQLPRPPEQARAGNPAGGGARSLLGVGGTATGGSGRGAAGEAAVADAEAEVATATAAESRRSCGRITGCSGRQDDCVLLRSEYRRQQMHRVAVDDERVVRHDRRT